MLAYTAIEDLFLAWLRSSALRLDGVLAVERVTTNLELTSSLSIYFRNEFSSLKTSLDISRHSNRSIPLAASLAIMIFLGLRAAMHNPERM
ncbi:hypothetical protein CIHG_05137 [Coccidioides immitis H538.4]|uniref:Uncharacterized protein n=3 Tax=Coccidioides immitis TaxID=5501 RepID=A0A0J8U4P0_COCIT|nr:hypothetical protein CIRG_00191 [Coccidioides immitis RMSCC 2394]KMU81857.1 hypothetical protein CISG_02873 [Coccidioides immitis RMSCC 3703]KMU87196.1 hypothetical protein CIHG_05137 [Coccidioides immitis H538.4]